MIGEVVRKKFVPEVSVKIVVSKEKMEKGVSVSQGNLIHYGLEVVAFAGVTGYFALRCHRLETRVAELEEKMEAVLAHLTQPAHPRHVLPVRGPPETRRRPHPPSRPPPLERPTEDPRQRQRQSPRQPSEPREQREPPRHPPQTYSDDEALVSDGELDEELQEEYARLREEEIRVSGEQTGRRVSKESVED